MIERVAEILVDRLPRRDAAALLAASKQVHGAAAHRLRAPETAGSCAFCGATTMWNFAEERGHCCTTCYFANEQSIGASGMPRHLMRYA